MTMKKLSVLPLLLGCFSAIAFAQPRPVDKATATAVQTAPGTYYVRYEGGIFGSSKKESGILKFDDANQRIIFYRLKPTESEMFSLPYSSLLILFPDHTTDVSQTGKIMRTMPVPGAGVFGLLTSDAKYAKITFDDPDVEAEGTISFKFKKREELLTFIRTLGMKAEMKARGDAYYRPRSTPIY
jgi:hypothetical protein